MEAGSINCPQCGAAVAQDATQCQYCHALLETHACPKCMGMMFVGTKFCPHCGALAQQIAVGGTAKRRCPQCKVDLIDVMVARTPLEECAHCGGLWVDTKSFDTLVSDAEAQTAALGLNLPPPVEMSTQMRYLRCPQCGELMSRKNYADRSGVVIDICRPHGIWLDRDEIRRIIAFIRSGGLDRARKIETEQLQHERMMIEHERETPSMSDVTFQGSIGHHANVDLAADLIGGLASVVLHLIR